MVSKLMNSAVKYIPGLPIIPTFACTGNVNIITITFIFLGDDMCICKQSSTRGAESVVPRPATSATPESLKPILDLLHQKP